MPACISLAVVAPLRPAVATDFDTAFAGTNDYGDVGLLQTPTARMRKDGEFGLGVSTVRPYNQIHLDLQALPWLETALRYTDAIDSPYLAAEMYGDSQTYKDKSADLKIRLLTEDAYRPALAVGVQDLAGNGLFSGEYLVASHHFYDFDFSFGLGWGRLGAGGDIPNPLGVFGHHFNQTRAPGAGLAGGSGLIGARYWFTGKTIGAFGGVQWNTPLKGVALRVEYDANDYQHEANPDFLANPTSLNLPQATHINAALDYAPWRGVELGVGYERGNLVTAHIDIGFNFNHDQGPAKVSDPPIPAVTTVHDSAEVQGQKHEEIGENSQTASSNSIAPATETAFVIELRQQLTAQGIEFDGLTYVPELGEVQVWFSQERYLNPAKAIGRVARILCNTAPDKVTRFTLINIQDGLETYRFTLSRVDFERAATGQLDVDRVAEDAHIAGPTSNSLSQAEFLDRTHYPKYSWDAGPGLRQNIGGPDEFYATQIWARFDGGIKLTDRFQLDGTVGLNIWNNFDKLQQSSNSVLPHVRSDIVQYLKDGPNNLVKLEANYIWSPANDLYARGSVGIFEEMYGGVAGELLYRPYAQRWAVGVDANWLKQRDFNQRFSFLDYKVTTGFVTLYYDLPYHNVLVKVIAGRYLARDKGATLDVSRRFKNGIVCGVFATKTNVSAAEFGEGSFDKGLYISIPADLFFTTSSRELADGDFRPLTRDGGQRARDGIDLYSVTGESSPANIGNGWDEALH